MLGGMESFLKALVLYGRFLIREIPDLIGIFSFASILVYLFPAQKMEVIFIIYMLAYAFFIEKMWTYFFDPLKPINESVAEDKLPASYSVFGALFVCTIFGMSVFAAFILYSM